MTETKLKFIDMGELQGIEGSRNSVLRSSEDWYVSYNADSFLSSGPETALYDGQTWRILNGDWSEAYSEIINNNGSLEDCIKFYESKKVDSRSNWSTDD